MTRLTEGDSMDYNYVIEQERKSQSRKEDEYVKRDMYDTPAHQA